ncbi:lipopolysaccharide/colanic/teichoic acid biosynthesis glycosyltransferase [Martelella radicis]|uniref:Lipopolysaccharide/colanic/teichoic acid biosynthesis glycosyltransferase n=2 Tax=Martelella radicis TaxID=1397476 RepID=A0A7W6KK43_9HYPH|nr:lipopolysaccharide/colanic/teichoic acid biosynthesis glycosyltransferase [Martelella radicis]
MSAADFQASPTAHVQEMTSLPRRAFGHELVFTDNSRKRKLQLALKRLFDISISFGALVALSPLFLVVAILIKTDSPGPVFFSQVRWGRYGKKINIFKFRSMRNDLGDKTGVKQTVENDPRITRIGAFLRRTNIDELPQLFNVLRGDMSLIGPRCHAVGMLASGMLFEELVPEYHQRHIMRPGLSGLAQIRGWRGPTTRRGEARARIMCDLYYVSNYSFMLDMQILLATLRSEIGRGTGF